MHPCGVPDETPWLNASAKHPTQEAHTSIVAVFEFPWAEPPVDKYERVFEIGGAADHRPAQAQPALRATS